MKIIVTKKSPLEFSGDMLIYCICQPKGKNAPVCPHPILKKSINLAFKADDFAAKDGQTLLIYPENRSKKTKCFRILAVGLGNDELSRGSFRATGGIIAQAAKKTKAKQIMLVVPDSLDFTKSEISECLIEGIVLGNYSFNKYISKSDDNDKPTIITKITLSAQNDRAARKGVQLGLNAALATNMARDMANEPGNFMTSQNFAARSLELAKKFGGTDGHKYINSILDKLAPRLRAEEARGKHGRK